MRKLAIATAAAAMIAGLGMGTAAAHDERGWNRHDHRHIERGADVRRHHGRTEVVRVGLHRRYFDEAIPLRRLLGLDRDYRGYKVQSVTVQVRPHKSRGRLALIANGQVVDRARTREGRRIELRPDDARTLGRDLGRLQLGVRGRAYIDSIQVKLRAPRYGRGHGPVHRTKNDRRERQPDIAEQVVRIILDQIEIADGRYD